MNLPNYFMADLPPEAELSTTMIQEACDTLRRNREHYLANRSTAAMVELLAKVGQSWLEPENRFRKMALDLGPKATGFSSATLARGLDTFFRQLTKDNLEALLEQDLGDRRRLEQMAASAAEDITGRASIVVAPQVLVHIAAGNLPCSTLQSIVMGVLLRAAQFIKCASGTSLLPRLFAHSLYDADNKLGACLELAEWRGGRADLEQSLFNAADCLTVTGSDETIAAVRAKIPRHVRFVAYGHRISFGYIGRNVLQGLNARKIVARAAVDVVAWDQLGCLSPHVLYVEEGTGLSAEQFAGQLAEELAELERTQPRGQVAVEVAAAIASRRALYEARAAHSQRSAETPPTRLWRSADSTAWTVVYEADPRFQLSCLHRFIYVKPVADLDDAVRAADDVRGKVSTVGLAAPEERAEELVTKLARWGVTRVCPLGQMQTPPLAWRHDGRPALADLVQWTDWEM